MSDGAPGEAQHAARVGLLDRLKAAGYHFVTPTPATHRTVAGRRDRAALGDLRDVFGWSRPFGAGELADDLFDLLRRAGGLEPAGDLFRSSLRVSTLDGRLHLHSAPTGAADAVFLGPDSYRFVRFLEQAMEGVAAPGRVLDIGVGPGAGALALAARYPEAEVLGTDVNPAALSLLRANAAHQRLHVGGAEGPGLEPVDGLFDLIAANPPYLADPGGRTYRDGGGDLGVELGLSWVEAGVRRLAPGGRMMLYTGSPVRDGRDPVEARVREIASAAGFGLDYGEIDPDVFGSMLRGGAYREVERIAAVGAVLTRPGG